MDSAGSVGRAGELQRRESGIVGVEAEVAGEAREGCWGGTLGGEGGRAGTLSESGASGVRHAGCGGWRDGERAGLSAGAGTWMCDDAGLRKGAVSSSEVFAARLTDLQPGLQSCSPARKRRGANRWADLVEDSQASRRCRVPTRSGARAPSTSFGSSSIASGPAAAAPAGRLPLLNSM